jgi:integrase
MLTFLARLTEGNKQSTKHGRFAILRSFFNFLKDNFQLDFENPCDSAMLKRLFRPPKLYHRDVLDRDTVDEIIFRMDNARNRLILELMARGGMRVGEVLGLRPIDVTEGKIRIVSAKSGKEAELVFIPSKVAKRLARYIRERGIGQEDRVFPIQYSAVRAMVRDAGAKAGVKVTPHDFRRHAATYASRAGVPIEIVSKIILRHANLATTQRYLGRVSEIEARRWVENIYG